MAKGSLIKVLVVDDSALIRAVLTEILDSDSRLQVIDQAKDAFEARDLIKKHNPDVITLDIEMPKMNGISFLKNLMRLRPMPVVMISTLTQEGAPSTLEALELGAVDFVPKPKTDGGGSLEHARETIIEKVVSAAKARVKPFQDNVSPSVLQEKAKINAGLVSKKLLRPNFICAIGASTGGTEAIKEVITALPVNCPPVVVVQHIPESFSRSYAKRVNAASLVEVHEAENNQVLQPGHVYIAPGDSHLSIRRGASGFVCQLEQSDFVNRHRPSVTVLFDSVLAHAKTNCMGVLLTGMGNDGSEALLHMKEAGCHTIAQDEESSVVWGMPGAAVKMGGATKVLPLDRIAGDILANAFK
ncbi:MAG: chemotaxis response regulator protein-glutamate methylesterase [Agarilytica sp.]